MSLTLYNIFHFRNINIFLKEIVYKSIEDNHERWAPWMWRENHPSTSHHMTVAEPRLGVWGSYDSNSEGGWRDKLAVFWGYVIMHFEKMEDGL